MLPCWREQCSPIWHNIPNSKRSPIRTTAAPIRNKLPSEFYLHHDNYMLTSTVKFAAHPRQPTPDSAVAAPPVPVVPPRLLSSQTFRARASQIYLGAAPVFSCSCKLLLLQPFSGEAIANCPGGRGYTRSDHRKSAICRTPATSSFLNDLAVLRASFIRPARSSRALTALKSGGTPDGPNRPEPPQPRAVPGHLSMDALVASKRALYLAVILRSAARLASRPCRDDKESLISGA
jgi:hypothetical protein